MQDDFPRNDALGDWFEAYRQACPDPEPGSDFLPKMWARIEAREVSAAWFRQAAKALITVALAASLILGLTLSSLNRPSTYFDADFVEAMRADRMAALEPLHIERISELEPR